MSHVEENIFAFLHLEQSCLFDCPEILTPARLTYVRQVDNSVSLGHLILSPSDKEDVTGFGRRRPSKAR